MYVIVVAKYVTSTKRAKGAKYVIVTKRAKWAKNEQDQKKIFMFYSFVSFHFVCIISCLIMIIFVLFKVTQKWKNISCVCQSSSV